MLEARLPPRGFRGEHRCEFERTLRGEYCTEYGDVRPDGLRLCERHSERLRLEERVAYWLAMLAHVRLWSGEARSRESDDVVRLLEIEQARSTAALEHVYEQLRYSRDGEDGSRDGRAPPLLPPLFLLLSLAVTG